MKLLTPKGWLRQRIANSPDIDIAAGSLEAKLTSKMDSAVAKRAVQIEDHLTEVKVDRISNDEGKIRLRIALGTLVRQLRDRKRLTVAELAVKAQVSEGDIRDIEHDPRKVPRPRTISQLARFFQLPIQGLQQLSGLTTVVDARMSGAAMKYAAKSDDLSKLSESEREALDNFVTLLGKTTEK